MRLICTLLWSIASLMWLPWLAVAVRFLIDIAQGTVPGYSPWYNPTLIGAWPQFGWLDWQLVSWYPLMALSGMLLSAAAWRIYWVDNGWRLSRPAWLVVASILIPPLALALFYGDTRRRLRRRDAELDNEVYGARLRAERSGELTAEQLAQAAALHEPGASYRGLARFVTIVFIACLALGVTLIPWQVALLIFISVMLLWVLVMTRRAVIPQ